MGVVSAAGGETPGSQSRRPRDNYIAFMEWAGNSRQIVLQANSNRLQNTVHVHAVQNPHVRARSCTPILTEHDDAWLDLQDELRWTQTTERVPVAQRARRLATHLPRRPRRQDATLVTPGDFDVIQLAGDRPASRAAVYFLASPDNATQKYLYRVRLDGTAASG